MDERTGLPIVGLIGGGPSARMLQQAAISLGQSLRVLIESADDVTVAVTPGVSIGRYDDRGVLREFARGCDVLALGDAPVPLEHLAALAAEGSNVPGLRAARAVSDRDGRSAWLATWGDHEPPRGETTSPGETSPHSGTSPSVGARRRTLAVVAARSPFGQVATYPIAETRPAATGEGAGAGVVVVAPAPGIDPDAAVSAQRSVIDLAARLEVVGLLTVVLSETDRGLRLDDLALGPHPLGRWTLGGSRTSQYEQLLRAVLDYPLGDTASLAPVTATAPVHCGGPGGMRLDERLHHMFAADPGARVHLYGRRRPHAGCEIGHVTVLADDGEDARSRLVRAVRWLQEGRDE